MTDLRISAAAHGCGVEPSTLRYYERVGLVRPRRSEAGYRLYGRDELDRLSFVLAVKRLGVPLARIRELLGAWESEPCRSVNARLRALVEEELQTTRERIAEMRALESRFETALHRLGRLPDAGARCAPACPLLTGRAA